jgi:hypothetical protein
MSTVKELHLGVISNPGIPGEKSLNLKQISPRELVEMTKTNRPFALEMIKTNRSALFPGRHAIHFERH